MQEVVETKETSDLGDLVVGGTLVVMVGTAIIVGGTLAVGVMTGVGAAMFSGILLYKTRIYKPKFWNTMMDHPLATDLSLSAFFIVTIGSITATGLITGITAAGVTTVGVGLAVKYIGKVKTVGSYSLPKFQGFKNAEVAYEPALCAM